MAFTIPNSSVATYPPQAEPDSVDIDSLVLGYANSGVVSGCTVTYSSGLTVAVAAGVVTWQGTTAVLAGGNLTVGTAHATLNRFDLIVSNSSGTHSVVAGTAAANPTFPAIPATSVTLASVYIPAAATTLASGNIVDKRVLVSSNNISALVRKDGTTALTAAWAAGNFNITSKNSTNWINAATVSTAGAGTSGSPYTGWDTAIDWTKTYQTVYFPALSTGAVAYYGLSSGVTVTGLGTTLRGDQ